MNTWKISTTELDNNPKSHHPNFLPHLNVLLPLLHAANLNLGVQQLPSTSG